MTTLNVGNKIKIKVRKQLNPMVVQEALWQQDPASPLPAAKPNYPSSMLSAF